MPATQTIDRRGAGATHAAHDGQQHGEREGRQVVVDDRGRDLDGAHERDDA
jgi:hypothetical protein